MIEARKEGREGNKEGRKDGKKGRRKKVGRERETGKKVAKEDAYTIENPTKR